MIEASNRYSTIDLFLPRAAHDIVSSLVKQAGAGEAAAFDRQVDFWWVGLIIGVSKGHRKPASEFERDQLVKLHSGVVFDSDPWRIVHLELLALAEAGPEVLEVPGKVMNIAAEYAYGGVLWLADQLRGEPAPLNVLTTLMTAWLESLEI